ncbi:MAG: Holliday junction branch migration protein RuvA [Candidatus Magasanikbacteria bacterium]|nr:Holliday junction branch migration protein RuvA [Candidatus Magasanikbacteria bacterium]
MIAFLSGKLIGKTKTSFVVLAGEGVGYEIRVVPTFLVQKNIGDKVELFTFLKVAENALDLYGFESLEQKGFFELLISVSGVGPKSGLHILTLGSIKEISSAIARKDVSYLTQVSGIGKKTAERMIVELRSKIEKLVDAGEMEADNGALADVVDGLVSMGYSKAEARAAAKRIKDPNKNSEALLREALKLLSR